MKSSGSECVVRKKVLRGINRIRQGDAADISFVSVRSQPLGDFTVGNCQISPVTEKAHFLRLLPGESKGNVNEGKLGREDVTTETSSFILDHRISWGLILNTCSLDEVKIIKQKY